MSRPRTIYFGVGKRLRQQRLDHLARDEVLTPDEQVFYKAGLCQLHREERLRDNPAALKELETNIARLERENEELAARRAHLETQLRRLQSREFARFSVNETPAPYL